MKSNNRKQLRIIPKLLSKIFVIQYFIIFSFLSCDKNINQTEKLVGQWAIDKMVYKKENYKDSLYVNFLVIEKDNIISLPEISKFPEENDSKWYFSKKGMKIHSKNKIFNNNYSLKFIKDYDNKLLGIELISNDTYIRAYKFFQNFDLREQDWVNK